MDTRPKEFHPDATLAAELRTLIMGFRTTQLIYVAAKLGLADQLQKGPESPGRLAQLVGAEPQALRRLLRALASLGLFAETAAGEFELTASARLLQTNTAGSLRGAAILYGEEWVWQAYGQMLYCVQTGRTAFEHTHGQPLYDYLLQHPSAAGQFQDAMTAFSDQEAGAILAAYDFSKVHTLVDIGGGHGTLLAALLQAHPHLSGVVFDRAPVVSEADRLLAAAGLGARVRCVAGDFFVDDPPRADLYLLKSVLHNWDDTACVTILRACRRAMPRHAGLLVIERVIPPGNVPAEAKLFDINMLVTVGGQERTEQEYRRLFEASNLEFTRVIPTDSPLSLIQGCSGSDSELAPPVE